MRVKIAHRVQQSGHLLPGGDDAGRVPGRGYSKRSGEIEVLHPASSHTRMPLACPQTIGQEPSGSMNGTLRDS